MQLHAAQAQADGALYLHLGVLEVLVHGHEADELGVEAALLGDEVVDAGHGAVDCTASPQRPRQSVWPNRWASQ